MKKQAKNGKVRVNLIGINETFEVLNEKVSGNEVDIKNHEKVSSLMGCFSWKCENLIGN